MKSFFVRSSDPTQIKLLKLEILTNIANETNIPPILREFQAYISSQDKEFVAATIQAIGRCASNIKQVAETCLNGLVSLLSHRDRKFYFVTFPFLLLFTSTRVMTRERRASKASVFQPENELCSFQWMEARLMVTTAFVSLSGKKQVFHF
jgi:vesicle coat complex subunit